MTIVRIRCPKCGAENPGCGCIHDNGAWPTIPVFLNHLDAMGLMMLIAREEQEDGLSIAMEKTKPKIEDALNYLLEELRDRRA